MFYNTSCSSEAASNTKSRNSWKIKQKQDLERLPVTLDRQCKTTAVNTQRQYFQVTPYNLLTSPDQRTFLTQDYDFSAHALSSLLDGQVSFLVHVGDGEGHEHALFPHGSRDECSRQHCNETTPEHQLILHSACEKCAVIVEDVGLRNKTHRGKLRITDGGHWCTTYGYGTLAVIRFVLRAVKFLWIIFNNSNAMRVNKAIRKTIQRKMFLYYKMFYFTLINITYLYQSCLSSNDFRLFRSSCTSACRELPNTSVLLGGRRNKSPPPQCRKQHSAGF